MKVTLSYQAGSNPISPNFKKVQINLEHSDAIYTEQNVFVHENVSFAGARTPMVFNVSFFACNNTIMNDQSVKLSATYMQVKDDNQNGVLRTSTAEQNFPFSMFCQIRGQVDKEADHAKALFMINKA